LDKKTADPSVFGFTCYLPKDFLDGKPGRRVVHHQGLDTALKKSGARGPYREMKA
jgi:hypothetical protein